MDKRARIRWTGLLSILAATIVAVVYPHEDNAVVGVSPAVPHASQSLAVPAQNIASIVDGNTVDSTDGESDPFAPRGWQAPTPPVVPMPVTQQREVTPVILAPSGPPALPFRFVGNFSDGADQVVYLAHGDQAVVARLGDVIETNYKVVGVNPTQIEFEYLPTGDKQPLVFPVHDN